MKSDWPLQTRMALGHSIDPLLLLVSKQMAAKRTEFHAVFCQGSKDLLHNLVKMLQIPDGICCLWIYSGR